MEEKLLHGGDVASKLSQQEVRLRAAQQDALDRQQEKMRLARELAEKEDAALQLEEHFSSLQDEVDAKSRKLRKLLAKYQATVQEVKDLTHQFQVCVHLHIFCCCHVI